MPHPNTRPSLDPDSTDDPFHQSLAFTDEGCFLTRSTGPPLKIVRLVDLGGQGATETEEPYAARKRETVRATSGWIFL